MVGTNRSDILRGTPGRDVIAGLDGNDVILGLGGDALLGDQPAPGGPAETGEFDICNGQQGTDLAAADTCELEIQIEGVLPPEKG